MGWIRLSVRVYTCMIFGLKYAGGTDYFPSRVSLGDVIDLRREPNNLYNPGAVAAYYNGTKVGYLADEKQGIWSAIKQSSRYKAIVVGEILDEDGELAGLNVEIFIHSDVGEPAPEPRTEIPLRGRRRWRAGRIATALAVMFLTLAAMGAADSIGQSGVTQDTLRPKVQAELVERRQEPSIGLADVMRLNRSDRQSVHLPDGRTTKRASGPQHPRPSMEAETDARQQQADELARKVQEAAAHRQQALAHWQADRHKLQTEIAQLQRHIGELKQAQRLREERRARILALQEMNAQELIQHRQRLIAWKLISQSQKRAVLLRQVAKAQKETVALPPAAKTPEKPVPPDAAVKARKKANFNRYAQQGPKPVSE
jgi:hypothetical protein